MDNTSNKSRNLLYRLRHLSIRSKSTNSTAARALNNGKITNCNNNISSSNNNTNNRKSFRRSLKKMHTRVKNALCRQKAGRNSLTSLGAVQEQLQLDIQPEQANTVRESSPNCQTFRTRAPTDEIANCSWYWGPLTVIQAEEKLQNEPDGAFLIRDSSSASYLFSISFRSVGRTLHSRIEHSRGQYSLYGQEGFATITELIENAVRISEVGIYCYSKISDNQPNYPVRLVKPVSRYTKVPTLKYLCRFVIRQYTNINDIPRLPLPTVLYNYLREGPYF